MKACCIFFFSILILGCAGQNAIFEINENNTVLINPASAYFDANHRYSSLLSDSRFDIFNKNKKFITSNLNFNVLTRNNFSFGLNCQYDKQDKDAEVKSLSLFSAYHKEIGEYAFFSGGISVGYAGIRTFGDYSFLRFSDEEIFYGKSKFGMMDICAGLRLKFKENEIGLSLNNMSLSKLPDDEAKKLNSPELNAYFRKHFLDNRFSLMLISRNKKKILLNETGNEFVNLSYTGINLDFYYIRMQYGVSYKQLYNNKSVYGVTLGFRSKFSLRYTIAVMPEKDKDISLLNQISAAYKIGSTRTRLGGSVRFL